MLIDWLDLARCDDLVVALDLDGTLVPYALTPDAAVIDEPLVELLTRLSSLPRTTVAIVSGRPRSMLVDLVARLPALVYVGEHGAWRAADGATTDVLPPTPELAELEAALRALAARAPGAIVEHKQASVCLHWRAVPHATRDVLVTGAETRVDEWLETQPEFERLDGSEMLEVRHRTAHKGNALLWLRQRAPAGARILALGDDHTDEDLFMGLDARDAAVRVGTPHRRTHANGQVADVEAARTLLGWLCAARTRPVGTPPAMVSDPERHDTRPESFPLLVVSNRLPSDGGGRTREVGGLTSALEAALTRHRGVWLGWSGRDRDPGLALTYNDDAMPPRASFDYPPGWRRTFYGGFCNRALWPLFHCMPGRVRYVDEEWRAYVDANRAYARMASSLIDPEATIWAQDYHLLLLAQELRRMGHRGRIGTFLHVPFPPRDVLETCPWARSILGAMQEFDLVGVQTWRACSNLRDCIDVIGAKRPDRAVDVRVFPVGIDPDAFHSFAGTADAADVTALREHVGKRKLVLGVDRLDYSKGIPERLSAFARLLEKFPEWRGQVVFVQVSVPSRADVPDYADLRHRVETMVGRINGTYGEADWTPVRYLYRSYPPAVLAQLYRAADVALVTPLRDGMNLVAKEFVASQDRADPGVLMLSRFAGAAEEMERALLTNPYHVDGMAVDLDQALRMNAAERVERHRDLERVVRRGSAQAWASAFLSALEEHPVLDRPARAPSVPPE
jgi:alpha,alpha-trehalose-phosphate synthase [UDP-forming]/trehalose-phosphatase